MGHHNVFFIFFPSLDIPILFLYLTFTPWKDLWGFTIKFPLLNIFVIAWLLPFYSLPCGSTLFYHVALWIYFMRFFKREKIWHLKSVFNVVFLNYLFFELFSSIPLFFFCCKLHIIVLMLHVIFYLLVPTTSHGNPLWRMSYKVGHFIKIPWGKKLNLMMIIIN